MSHYRHYAAMHAESVGTGCYSGKMLETPRQQIAEQHHMISLFIDGAALSPFRVPQMVSPRF